MNVHVQPFITPSNTIFKWVKNQKNRQEQWNVSLSLVINQGLMKEQKQQRKNYAPFSFPPKYASQNETKFVKSRFLKKTCNHWKIRLEIDWFESCFFFLLWVPS
jgi:hypothetical protein